MFEERTRYIIEFDDIPSERSRMPEVPVGERIKNFEEIEKGFTPEQAQREAQRCLSCRRCLGCKLCLAACEKEAIDFDQQDEESELEVDSIIITPGVLRTPAPLDERFGYGKFLNVVSDLDFEKILHPEGPYGGLMLRPYDGETPKKIGFIYHDEKALNHRALTLLLKEAGVAKKKIPDVELWLLCAHKGDAASLAKPFREQLPELISKTCTTLSITECGETGNLMVEFLEDGEKRREEFQMVVISTTVQLPASLKRIGEQLGLKLTQRVEPTEDPSPQPTTKEGISVAGGITLS